MIQGTDYESALSPESACYPNIYHLSDGRLAGTPFLSASSRSPQI